jgi:surfeit locus 1 family protein
MFLLLLALGTWQVQRLHWKEGLIAQRAAGVAAPPASPPATLNEARALEFHHVRAAGAFDHKGELYLNAISKDGKPGFHIVTPLKLAGGDTLFVERGFVPVERRDPATREAGQLAGTVAVTGLLRLAPEKKPSWFIPDNDAKADRWFYIDLAGMAAADGIGSYLPYYIDADATPVPGGLPRGGQTNLALPNDHLQYAITWYLLAAAMPVLYFFLWRNYRKRDS